MGGVDKLAALVGGRPLLAWTLEALAAARTVRRIVVVTSADRVADVAAAAWPPDPVVAVVAGGNRRQESVAEGLLALDGLDSRSGSIVLVHDGARPLVSPALVDAVALAADRHGAAIPGLAVAETLKRVAAGRIIGTVDRSDLVAAQTPQGMRRSVLRRAFRRFPPDGPAEFTDEAALLEACRIRVHVIPGDPVNLKVTVPDDLRRVESTLASSARSGFGADTHPFGPGTGLRLGGIELAEAPRLHGHSDGDVVLHAVADALLGAARLGDLGRLFPADRRTPRGIDSRTLLAMVVDRLAAAGWRPSQVDITIVGARPRLGSRLDEMSKAIAALLGLDAGRVNVKASTGNLDGATGAGRAIAAQALATILPAGGPTPEGAGSPVGAPASSRRSGR